MYYKLWISETSAFTSLVVNENVSAVSDYTLEENQALDPYTKYWWKVKAIDSQTGNASGWSDACWFRVIAEDYEYDHTLSGATILYTTYNHRFVRSYDYDCSVPDARIGSLPSGTAQISVVLGTSACTGVPMCDGVRTNPFSEGFTYYFQFTKQIVFTAGTHEIEII